ncbi:prolyl oligopeptidase family serine peptidase [Asticcacaulis sp. W401b]|uniref:prolyl oligopeptidase family serine peptidase n=1 Tax=Asticcacaulis sp. W401b TaxID=3388666 RepID=UPI00397098A1
MIEAPHVLETAISGDGQRGLVLVRYDDLSTNQRTRYLIEVDLQTGARRHLLKAEWISRIEAIPNSEDWSVLTDQGEGVQLYRICADGQISRLVAGASTVLIGADPRRAVLMSTTEASHRFGVLDYGWAPDGRYLWYSTARVVDPLPGVFQVMENPLEPLDSYVPNQSELRLRSPDGNERLLATARGEDRPYPTIVYGAQAATWQAKTGQGNEPVLVYKALVPTADGRLVFSLRHLGVISGSHEPPFQEASGIHGPNGGTLEISGFGAERALRERLSSGEVKTFGPIDFEIGTALAPLARTYPSLGFGVYGARYRTGVVRNGLIRVSKDQIDSVPVSHDLSLSQCSAADLQPVAVCIREGLNAPPEIVRVDLRTLTLRDLGAIDERYARLPALKAEARAWHKDDLTVSGFVLLPRGYRKGASYPAIVVTHGGDADNRFVNPEIQWSYPLQQWSERGFVVVYINDLVQSDNVERLEAFRQWFAKKGTLPGDKVVQRVWLDQVAMFKAAIDALAQEGLVDPSRVGIVGYSRGSQIVNMAVTQSDLFRVASSGDGGYFAPSSYWTEGINPTQQMLFGGSPYDAAARKNWERAAPVFRAGNVRAAVLFQAARVLSSRVDFFQALRACKKPAEFGFFPDETHLLHVPSNRAVAMTQNLEWFDFWLKGEESGDPVKAQQYMRWRRMRNDLAADASKEACPPQPAPNAF